MPFDHLGLRPALVQAALDSGFAEPTPVQAQAVPAILRGRDVLALAQTGSGKTAAFSLPLIQRWADTPAATGARAVRVLVLAPTRELAVQVGEVMRSLARTLERAPKIAVLYGGVSVNPQMLALRGGADIVVATPGRLLDLQRRNALRLSHVAALVLDEADRLLDLGFADELASLLELLPAARQNLFFSATFPPAIEALARRVLREPLRIEVEATPANLPDIAQRAIEVDAPRRTQLLRHLVVHERWSRVLVFVATQYAADTVASKLRRADIAAEAFHGELSQGKRSQVVADFKASRVKVVVATDLAARGIDIAQLPVVVNYDLPRSPVDQVHRIGRTGRAGEHGLAVSFVTAEAAAHFRLIEKRLGLAVPRERVAGFEPVERPADAPDVPQSHDASDTPGRGAPAEAADAAAQRAKAAAAGGIKGRRPSKKDKLRAAASASAGSGAATPSMSAADRAPASAPASAPAPARAPPPPPPSPSPSP
ncbi:MAG: DEAD/DEAH box helicase, partial [Comamonadaceae bacterium]